MQVSAEMIMHAFFISLSFLLVYLYRRQKTGSVTAYLEIIYLSGKTLDLVHSFQTITLLRTHDNIGLLIA